MLIQGLCRVVCSQLDIGHSVFAPLLLRHRSTDYNNLVTVVLLVNCVTSGYNSKEFRWSEQHFCLIIPHSRIFLHTRYLQLINLSFVLWNFRSIFVT